MSLEEAGKEGPGLHRKLVFLDVDGVLHPLVDNVVVGADMAELNHRADEYSRGTFTEFPTFPGEFLPSCLAALNRLVTESLAEIVLTSTWRLDPLQGAAVDRELATAGIPPCIGRTPDIGMFGAVRNGHDARSRRAVEIQCWLEANHLFGEEGVSWVVLDDQDICAAAVDERRRLRAGV